jgi:hypothetical protein
MGKFKIFRRRWRRLKSNRNQWNTNILEGNA